MLDSFVYIVYIKSAVNVSHLAQEFWDWLSSVHEHVSFHLDTFPFL